MRELHECAIPQLDVSRFDAAEVREALTHVARLQSELDALQLSLVAIVADSRDAAAMINRLTGCGFRDAKDTVCAARVVASNPEIVPLLRSGELATAHLRTLGHDLNREEISRLLPSATSQHSDDFEGTVRRFIVDRDAEKIGDRQKAERTLRFTTRRDGLVGIHGVLPMIEGTELKNRLHQIADEAWRAKYPDQADNLGGHYLAGERQDQRLADALVSLSQGKGTGADQPAVIVTIDAATLEAELIGEGPIPLQDAQAILERAKVYSLIRDTRGIVMNFGRERRLATAMQRLVRIAMDKRCQIPGCRHHYRYTQVHHMKEHDEGGPTDLENLVLVCAMHHRHLHLNRLKIERKDGVIRMVSRDGPGEVGSPAA